MKLTLRFSHSDSPAFPCACVVDTPDRKSFCCSTAKTWTEAEAEALQKAKAMLNVGEPPQPKQLTI